jgi:hypothetical protein
MLFSLKATIVMALATITLADDCNENTEPIQIRLAYAGDRGMTVSWNTKQQLSNPTVYFGTSGDLDSSASSDISITYPTSSTYNNHVTITGLQPDTRYHYKPQCGDRAYIFTTARSAGNGNKFKFAMVGDLGTMGQDGLSTTVGSGASNPLLPGERNTIQSLDSLKMTYEFVWHGLSPSLDIVFIS